MSSDPLVEVVHTDPETVAPTPMGPTSAGERVETIDVLRGLALFGILAANIRGFAGPPAAYFTPAVYWSSLPDRIAQALIDTFIQGKFITIFGVLFGAGFAAQLARAEGRGTRFERLYARRLLALVAFGLVHGLLIWFGDILFVYGWTGFLLLFFRKRSDKTITTWAIVGYLVPLLIFSLAFAGSLVLEEPIPGPPVPTATELGEITATYASGGWSAIQRQRTLDVVGQNWAFFPLICTHVLALFLVGVLAWRKRFFTPEPAKLAGYRQMMKWGFIVGLTGNVAATAVGWIFEPPLFPPTAASMVVLALEAVGVPALSLAYICSVILLFHNETWRPRLARFGAVGRTALSNYLLQSILGTLIFYGYGLGLAGRMGPALLLIPTVVIFALEVLISGWWIERFRFGPAEWLWRSLTYGKLQPMAKEK